MTSVRVSVPKLNNNDDSYVLLQWLVQEGQAVAEGEAVVVLETSKAAEEIDSPCAGVLHHIAAEESQCRPGEVIATIAAPGALPDDLGVDEAERALEGSGQAQTASSAARDREIVVTDPARVLAERYHIDIASLASLGKPIIRVADIEQIRGATANGARTERATRAPERLASGPGWSSYRLPDNQQHVARRVTESHQLTPAALAVMKLQLDPLLARAKELAVQLGIFIGWPELLLQITARLRGDHPMMFARPCAENPLKEMQVAGSADVGVTVDVGTGLYIPVIKSADTLSLREIAQAFMRARRGAMRGGLAVEDRGEPALVIAISTTDDVVLTVPLIYPGTVATLMLAGPQRELQLTADGVPRANTFTNIGLAYDHRYINGRDAISFLQAVKRSAESPTSVEADDEMPK